MEVFREFRSEAAHLLPRLPEGHKCGRLHGHSFRATVFVSGEPDERGCILCSGPLGCACLHAGTRYRGAGFPWGLRRCFHRPPSMPSGR
ncbi:MAG: 6-carboxytetrahydropterin synthase [Planctomycetes bacterium]|nr:6-carboxytetrahydropterin synthase [Planctomycetota bacterium]